MGRSRLVAAPRHSPSLPITHASTARLRPILSCRILSFLTSLAFPAVVVPGKRAKDFMDSGVLVPDDVVVDMIKDRLAQPVSNA